MFLSTAEKSKAEETLKTDCSPAKESHMPNKFWNAAKTENSKAEKEIFFCQPFMVEVSESAGQWVVVFNKTTNESIEQTNKGTVYPRSSCTDHMHSSEKNSQNDLLARQWNAATQDPLSDVYTPIVSISCYSSTTLLNFFVFPF